ETAQLLEQCLAHLRQPDVVSLPPAIVSLIEANPTTSTERRADWHSDRSPSQRRAASFAFSKRSTRLLSLVAASLLVVLIGIGLWNHWWLGSDSAAPPPSTQPSLAVNPPATKADNSLPIRALSPARPALTVSTMPPATTSWDNDISRE